MSKVKEYYYEQLNSNCLDRESRSRIMPANRPRDTKGDIRPWAEEPVEESSSTPPELTEDQKLDAIDEIHRQNDERNRQKKIAYYNAFSEVLKAYGLVNRTQPLLDCIEQGNWSENVKKGFKAYNSSLDVLRAKNATNHAILNSNARNLRRVAAEVGLYSVRGEDELYYDKKRRERYNIIIKREVAQLEKGDDKKVLSPDNIEKEYCAWCEKQATRKPRRRKNDKGPN